MRTALSRSLLAVITLALLMAGGFALPAEAVQGTPVPSTEGGTVAAWGGGGYPGTTAALNGTTVVAIAAGGYHDLALTSAGKVVAWGSQPSVPASLDGKTVTAIAAGRGHSLALTSDGRVTAWGDDSEGQTDVPTSLDGKTVTAIAAGGYHNLALTSDGRITAWGYSSTGATNVPASLDGKTVTAIAAGAYNSFAVTADGRLTGWGYSPYGASTPPASLDGKTVTAVAAGLYQTLALTSDGKVTAWGGDPQTGEGVVPATLDDKTVVAVTAGYNDSFALTSDGRVVGWGDNSRGQTSPPAGLDADTVTALSAGESHVIAIVRTVLPDGPPVLTGTPRVGSPLTATDGPYNAAPDSVSYQWKAGGSDVGTDSVSYIPGPADAGKTVAVTVTATRVGYAPSSTTSATTAAVANATFGAGPTATISGTAEVGQTLTADEGDASPAPDSYAYRWFAGGTPVSGADSRSLTLTSAQKSTAVTVEVTAVKAGYDSVSDLSEPTIVVGAGRLTVTGSLSVDGTPEVGQALTVTSTVETTPSAPLSGRWLRDGSPIAGATSTTYTPTNADAGAGITYQLTATRDGYDDASVTSSSLGPVEGGVITPAAPMVVGAPEVGSPLTASVAGFDPADADVAFVWRRGGTILGHGGTYTPSAGDAGQPLTVTATYTKDHFHPAGSSTVTDAVADGTFTTAPEAGISGTAKVGQLLTAGRGAASPTPDSYHYRWFADGRAIPGAADSTFLLTGAQKHKVVTVEVTAARAGFVPVSDLSDPTGAVATGAVPTIDLTVAKARIRRGQRITLAWSSDEAVSVTASRGWTGTRQPSGTLTVRPTRVGTTSYELTAANENGTTTAVATVTVTRQAHRLAVAASNGLRLRGKRITVRASGLDSAEPYAIRIGGRAVALGHAGRSGRVERSVTIPTDTLEGPARVSVTGSEKDRTGTDTVRVVGNKALGIRLAQQRVRASDHQRVTVTGLAAGERVTVTYQGRRLSARSARAGSRGTFTTSFGVDVYWGTKTVVATGQYSGRTAKRTFAVVPRCASGAHVCR
jgi:hypothetical protein